MFVTAVFLLKFVSTTAKDFGKHPLLFANQNLLFTKHLLIYILRVKIPFHCSYGLKATTPQSKCTLKQLMKAESIYHTKCVSTIQSFTIMVKYHLIEFMILQDL